MSIRTLIEINHDQLHRLIDRPDLMHLILEELGTSQHNAPMNEANGRGRPLEVGHGIRIVHQYHHSTDVTVKTEYAEIKL